MANEIRIRAVLKDEVTKELDRIHGGFAKVQQSKGFQAVTQGVGFGAGIGAFNLLSSGISSTVDLIQGSIKSASDLNEQVNKTKVVFGAASSTVLKFGETTASSIGISNRAALEAAGDFGNMFTAMGLTVGKSAEMSTSLVKLAADLASFNNIDPAEAMDKLRSGLSGEAEPLRTVGVLLNETQVSTEAMLLGFKKVGGAFTEAQKVQARYSLILKQTTSAQGDFANTSGSMANQQRTLSAESENASAQLGKSFLPIVVQIQKALITMAPALEHIIDMLAGTKPKAEDAALALNKDTLALKNILPEFKSVGTEGRDAFDLVIEGLITLDDAMRGDTTGAQKLTGAWTLAGDSALGLQERTKDMAFGFTTAAKTATTTSQATATAVTTMAQKIRLEMGLTKDTVKTEIADMVAYTHDRLTNKQIRDILTGKGSLGAQLEKGLKDKRPDVRQKAQDIVDELTAILNARVGIVVTVTAHKGTGKALGGPVKANQAYIVGENRPELFIPDTDGTIIPNVPSTSSPSAWGGGGGGVTLVYSPQFSTASASEAQRFMQAIAKPLTIEMNRQRLL